MIQVVIPTKIMYICIPDELVAFETETSFPGV